MKNKLISILLGFGFILSAYAGPPIWNLEQSPTIEVLNGLSAANNFYAMGVGENGSIVEFIDGDSGSLMNSGTDKDLYDVFVASQQLALASGEDIVLLWDGSDWQPIVDSATNTFYTGTWITPERDYAFYQSLGFFNIICPYEIGAVTQGFCRAHSSPMLTMCGESDDIKLIMADGDILHYNNQLGEFEGSIDPLHDQINPLNLTGVYVPGTSCLPGPFKPTEIYAINNTDELYYFDGVQWSDMGVSIPNDQTLTWLNGSGGNDIVATGFKPNGMSGNDGVIWTYDGTIWAEDSNLPAGTPGLTDVAVNVSLVDTIFINGFDGLNRSFDFADVLGGKVAVGEEGRLVGINVIPTLVSDLSVSKKLLTSEPIAMGDSIAFELTIKNRGPSGQVEIYFTDRYKDTIQINTDNCNMAESSVHNGWHNRTTTIASLAAGETQTCTMEFNVIGEVGDPIINGAGIRAHNSDPIPYNNKSIVDGIIIQPSN